MEKFHHMFMLSIIVFFFKVTFIGKRIQKKYSLYVGTLLGSNTSGKSLLPEATHYYLNFKTNRDNIIWTINKYFKDYSPYIVPDFRYLNILVSSHTKGISIVIYVTNSLCVGGKILKRCQRWRLIFNSTLDHDPIITLTPLYFYSHG